MGSSESIAGWVGQQDGTGQPIVPGSAIEGFLCAVVCLSRVDTEGIFPDEDKKQAIQAIRVIPLRLVVWWTDS